MSQSIRTYLSLGPATSKEIQAASGLSQSAVSRAIRELGDSVVKLQNGRSPRYALTRNAFGGNDRLPLSIVDTHGDASLIAYVRPLAHGGFYVEPTADSSPLLLGESGSGSYADLPYFLLDLAPQGFIGRKIAEEMARQTDDFPNDPRRWSTNHIGRYLISNGDDLPGNFKFGEQALLRVRHKPTAVPDESYPELANSVLSGAIPRSPAGGEQPKFTAYSESSSAHVIVKFSPKGNNEITRRWKDILITEYHAAKALRQRGFLAAETRLIDSDGRLFLEAIRFDRSGEYGRRSMISLQSIDAEFSGLASSWPQVFSALHKQGLVCEQQSIDAECLWCFGRLINNSDMLLGNLSLAIEGNQFKLLPTYDMCSMGFAPRGGGEVLPFDFVATMPKRLNIDAELLQTITDIARDFWNRVDADERISDEFRTFLGGGNPVAKMLEGSRGRGSRG
jgi:hypothetical protein